MPQLKILHVASFTSEDKKFPAENLLRDDVYLKWKCATAGEKQAIVVFQFDKSSCIHSIDVGNEGSAFVEVLVGRQSDNDEQNYKVILPASSFMSPGESRNETNLNRVRMFGPDKLAKQVMEEKWDRVKVVCTQPFNKHIQYGLAFVKFHSPSESGQDEPPSATSKLKLGAFSMKEDKSLDLQPGSLFAKRKTDEQNSSAAPKAASEATKGKLTSKETEEKVKLPAKRKLETVISAKPEATKKRPVDKKDVSSDTKAQLKTSVANPSTGNGKVKQSVKPVEKAASPKGKGVMSGIVFALSGFVNPQRSDLRDKALELGAKYKPDWDSLCTHLVCAFANTPKFLQVRKEGGKIVSQKWIVDCHRKKQLLSWKGYKLVDDNNDSTSDSDADRDAKEVPKVGQKVSQPSVPDEYGASTDVESDQDTEGEIDRVRGNTLPDLPAIFRGKHFLLYGKFEDRDRQILKRYIIGFDGNFSELMNDKVTHVITEEDWDEKFDDALATNGQLQFIRSEWLLRCADQRNCIPEKPYLVTP